MSNDLKADEYIHHSDVGTQKHSPHRWYIDDIDDLEDQSFTSEDLYCTAWTPDGVVWVLVGLEGDGRFRPLESDMGRTGMKGLDGMPGPMGESGETGALGSRGPAGYPGEKGERGRIGPIGPRGRQGPRGKKGEDGTPPPDLRSIPQTYKIGTIWSKDKPLDIPVGMDYMQANLAKSVHVHTTRSMTNYSGSKNKEHRLEISGRGHIVNGSGVTGESGRSKVSIEAKNNKGYSHLNHIRGQWRTSGRPYLPDGVTPEILISSTHSQVCGMEVKMSAYKTPIQLIMEQCQINPITILTSHAEDLRFRIDAKHSQIMTGYVGAMANIDLKEDHMSVWISSGRSLWPTSKDAGFYREDFFWSMEKDQWLGIENNL